MSGAAAPDIPEISQYEGVMFVRFAGRLARFA
jgi:hypothetical protein